MKLFLVSLFFLSTFVYAQASNELIDEDSPYLQQHAYNPVNWHPWNEETLAKAKQTHKPIFLSIGYSTCHWCHVMARESFEDEASAKLINENYIAIKVDREELPHLDKYYQKLHIFLKKRSGGWPLTAILTEDAKPFFVGTYFPPTDTYNIEGLDSLLPRLASAYKNNKEKVFTQALAIENMMQSIDNAELKPVHLDLSIRDDIFKGLKKQFDEVYYGFSTRPKFPESSKISLLFDLDALGVKGAREMALKTLRTISLHGLYDQVEGGFFRYSVDAAWEIPHFEKMLYTNAELIPLYVKAYELTGDELYKQVVTETISMIEEKFQEGGLYSSASDSDSQHQEGGYYIYTYEEVILSLKDLEPDEREKLIKVLDISEEGNFEEHTHINFYDDKRPPAFEKIRSKLQELRKTRKYPFIDKKINTAWNSMMIEALFSASSLDEKYQTLAEKRMEALVDKMYIKGVLYHQSLRNKEPVQEGLLEDYAFLVSALLRGYEENLDENYLYLIKSLSDKSIKKFYDGEFWCLSDDGLRVYADMLDKYYTAPMNKMLMSLLKLASLTGEMKYLSVVKDNLNRKSAFLDKSPSDFPSAMQVLLREKKGYVTLKAKEEDLVRSRSKIKSIKHPFVLIKTDNTVKAYLACDMGQCFCMDKDLDKVIEMIENR